MQLSLSKHAGSLAVRLTRRPRHQIWVRSYTQRQRNEPRRIVGQTLPFVSEEPIDPRPRWMFSTASLLRVVLIPVGLVYAVFYHDFGEEEHVFMPPRRWLQRQKESFFTLSAAERGLVKDGDDGDERRQA